MSPIRLCLPALLTTLSLSAQSVTGSFATVDEDRPLTITLREEIRGEVRGFLTSDGATLPIEASRQNGQVIGVVVGVRFRLHLEARMDGPDLIVSLQDLDLTGRPRPETIQRFRMVSTEVTDRDREDPTPLPREPVGGRTPPYNPYVPNPLSPYPYGHPLDPLIGRFSDGYLTLDLTGGNNRYSGSLAFDGEAHRVTLERRRDGNLEGGYWDGTLEHPVVVTPTLDGVSLVSDGEWYHLPRLGYGPASGRRRGAGGRPGRGYVTGPIPWPMGGGVVREGDFAAWLVGKAIHFPERSAIREIPGVYSRRVYHLCAADELLFQDYETATVQPDPPGPNRRFTLVTGVWQLAWNDVTLDLEILLNTGFVDRLELSYRGNEVYANGEVVYVGFSDLCR